MKVGLDFGTTNSSIARIAENGDVELARFSLSGALTESFRSSALSGTAEERGPQHYQILGRPRRNRTLS